MHCATQSSAISVDGGLNRITELYINDLENGFSI